jgi:hypothetical protein
LDIASVKGENMIEVSVLTGNHDPVGEGVPFQLLAEDGSVISSGATDAAGVVTFDVETAGLGSVAIRWAPEPSPAGNGGEAVAGATRSG